jgi:hypothetical protein
MTTVAPGHDYVLWKDNGLASGSLYREMAGGPGSEFFTSTGVWEKPVMSDREMVVIPGFESVTPLFGANQVLADLAREHLHPGDRLSIATVGMNAAGIATYLVDAPDSAAYRFVFWRKTTPIGAPELSVHFKADVLDITEDAAAPAAAPEPPPDAGRTHFEWVLHHQTLYSRRSDQQEFRACQDPKSKADALQLSAGDLLIEWRSDLRDRWLTLCFGPRLSVDSMKAAAELATAFSDWRRARMDPFAPPLPAPAPPPPAPCWFCEAPAIFIPNGMPQACAAHTPEAVTYAARLSAGGLQDTPEARGEVMRFVSEQRLANTQFAEELGFRTASDVQYSRRRPAHSSLSSPASPPAAEEIPLVGTTPHFEWP